MSEQQQKRRRHTRTSVRVANNGTAAQTSTLGPNVTVQAVPYVNSAARELMDELLGPVTMHSTGDRDGEYPNQERNADGNDEPDSERDVIILTEGTPSLLKTRLLGDKSYLSPFEEMAVVGNLPLDPVVERITQRLITPAQVAAENFFVVRGLSTPVPSHAYEQTRLEQAKIQAQLNLLNAGYESWSYFDQYVSSAMARDTASARARAAECFRRLAEQFVPQPTVLKPASVSRALNELWRDMLTSELRAMRARYFDATAAAMRRYAVPDSAARAAEHADSIAEQYVVALVDPFLRRQLAIIEHSNYDEMPILWSTLRDLFDSYLTRAARYLNTPADERRDTPIDNGDDDRELSCFMANVLETYAQPEFLRVWLPAWLARNPQPARVSSALTNYVKKIVAYRQRQFESDAAATNYLRFYIPMTEDDARKAYRKLITSDIALGRARVAANVDFVRKSIIEYFNNPHAIFLEPPWLAFMLPSTFFEFIDLLNSAAQIDIAETYRISPTDTDAQKDQMTEGFLVATARLDEHVRQLEQRLALYGVVRARHNSIAPHGPADGIETRVDSGDAWSSFDLSFPLNPTTSSAQIDQLVAVVARTSEEFNADAQQTRAHNVRRAIDRDYTLKLIERRQAELEYQLDELTSPIEQTPQRVVYNVNSGEQVELRVEIALSPQLERRILSMSDSLLEPDERAAPDVLVTSRFRFDWYFKRAGNDVTPNVPEVLVRSTLGERGVLVDTYPLFNATDATAGVSGATSALLARIRHALTRAGVYRVEVRRLEEDAAPEDAIVYRSLFQATVQVVARCMRDNALFEPHASGDGALQNACCWQQALPSPDYENYLKELVTLVEHGPQAHKNLIESRARAGLGFWEGLATQVASVGRRLTLPLPPWGLSTPTQLMLVSQEPRDSLLQRFTFEAIYTRFRRRVGQFLAYVLLVNERLANLLPTSSNYTEDELFNLYLGSTLKNAAVASALREAAARGGIFDANGVLTTSEERRANMPNKLTIGKIVTMAARTIESVGAPLARRVPPTDNSTNASQASGSVLTIARAVPTPVDDESMVAVLQRLAHPFAQMMMTERERSFFSSVERDFDSLRGVYRRHLRTDVWRRSLECEQTGGLRHRREHGEPSDLSPVDTVLSVEEDVCIDDELGRMTATQVARLVAEDTDDFALFRKMFVDVQSIGDYDRLLRTCLLEDDFSQLMRDRAREQRSVRGERFVGRNDIVRERLERPPIGECCLDGRADEVIPTWLGTHSAITDQPQPLVIGYTGRSTLGAEFAKRAYVAEPGSQPAHRNVDFTGLRNIVHAACAHYTDVVDALERRTPPADPTEVRAQVNAAHTACEQMALVFNYFALASPPLPVLYEAHRLMEEIRNGKTFARLNFSLPLV